MPPIISWSAGPCMVLDLKKSGCSPFFAPYKASKIPIGINKMPNIKFILIVIRNKNTKNACK